MKNIYYLGQEGSYSHNITKKVFEADKLISCNSFADIIKSTLTQKNSIGVLPIENSITSNVHENMDYLFRENLTIISEAYLKIRLHLIGFKNAEIEDIKKVYSHPQALSQCREYIKKHNFTTQETGSTAEAINLILKINDKRVAAIGGKELTKGQNLKILEEYIGDEKFNITRFVFVSAVIARAEAEGRARLLDRRVDEAISLNNRIVSNKASIMFSLPNKPGTLANILTEFSKTKFNLVKIDSRPIPATNWEYQFWVDMENRDGQTIDKKTLTETLKNNTRNFKIIGIYPSGKIYE